MTKLNDKQIAVLGNAVSRPEGNVLPLPEDMQMKGGGLAAMLKALERRCLVQRSEDAWAITDAGRAAVAGVVEGDKSEDEKAEPQGASEDAGDGDGVATPLFRPGTRQAQLLDLLQREEGADIDEMVQLTGWQPHSVRAVLTGFRKRGVEVTRMKEGNGVSVYRVFAPTNAVEAAG
ncbi:MAG: hypothetical protein TEF_14325 [Rhizobiales bacterium NRL2]|jgi:hypothetical protein|nr:MAG: hypothetical protein TEF_14325 [Rhizobiales bacterium NRL2]